MYLGLHSFAVNRFVMMEYAHDVCREQRRRASDIKSSLLVFVLLEYKLLTVKIVPVKIIRLRRIDAHNIYYKHYTGGIIEPYSVLDK